MIYEFQCTKCNSIFEVRASLSEKEKGLEPHCPECSSGDTHQIVAAFAMGASGHDVSSYQSGHSHGGSSCSSCSSGSCGSCGH